MLPSLIEVSRWRKVMKTIYLFPTVIFFSVTLVPVVYAGGDAEQGKEVFKKCKMCHTIKEDGKHKFGPNLFGTFGHSAGTNKKDANKKYEKYSRGLKNYGEKGNMWCEENLNRFLKSPKREAKAKMPFNLREEEDRKNVVAYLKENSNNTAACEKRSI